MERKSDKKRHSRRYYRRKDEWLIEDRQQGRWNRFGGNEVIAEEEKSRHDGMDPVKNVLGCLLGGVRWSSGHKAPR